VSILAPILAALFAWFLSTGAILWLDRRPRATWAISLHFVSLLAIAGGATAVLVGDVEAPWAHYAGFVGALVLWGWHEMTFLMGYITGPRRTPMPVGARGWARFRAATETVIHHEVAIVLTLVLLAAATWGEANQTAMWTFAALTALRLSAKFNIFLGVPGLNPEMLPAHLGYLVSYFRTRPGNPLLPVSLGLALAATIWLSIQGLAAPSASGLRTGFLLVATLSALGLIEHVFLMVPWREAALWRWAMGGEAARPGTDAPQTDIHRAGGGTQCPFADLRGPVLPVAESD
jgi:putative photosynthetic complex assembly protein 2